MEEVQQRIGSKIFGRRKQAEYQLQTEQPIATAKYQ